MELIIGLPCAVLVQPWWPMSCVWFGLRTTIPNIFPQICHWNISHWPDPQAGFLQVGVPNIALMLIAECMINSCIFNR